MQSQHKAYLHILYFFWAENPSLVSFIWYIYVYIIYIYVYLDACMYISTCLSVCPLGTQPSVCLFHLFHLSCSFSKLSMGIHCTMTHAFVRALQQGIRLAKRPHHLTTHLILNRLGRLGDPSEYPLQCSPYFHRATPVTRPSSWCVCPVVVLSWLDNVFVCLSSPNSSPPLAETWKISRCHGGNFLWSGGWVEHLPHYQLSFEVQHLHPWEGHLGHLCCWGDLCGLNIFKPRPY